MSAMQVLADMQRGLAPNAATISGEVWPSRFGMRLRNFITKETDDKGSEMFGMPALVFRLRRLESAVKADPKSVEFLDLEQLQIFKLFLDDNDKQALAGLVDTVVKAHATVDLGGMASSGKRRRNEKGPPAEDGDGGRLVRLSRQILGRPAYRLRWSGHMRKSSRPPGNAS